MYSFPSPILLASACHGLCSLYITGLVKFRACEFCEHFLINLTKHAIHRFAYSVTLKKYPFELQAVRSYTFPFH